MSILLIVIAIILYNLYGVVSLMENSTNIENTNTTNTTNTTNSTITAVQNCDQQVQLKKKIATCLINNLCCRNTIYETQFQTELKKCTGPATGANIPANVTATCNRFKTCQATCKNKLPNGYVCRDGNNVGRNSIDLYDCYTTCFNKLYNCPTNQILTNSTGKYLVSTAELAIVCVIVALFIICLFGVTFCREDNITSRKSRSKIHIATTSGVSHFSSV